MVKILNTFLSKSCPSLPIIPLLPFPSHFGILRWVRTLTSLISFSIVCSQLYPIIYIIPRSQPVEDLELTDSKPLPDLPRFENNSVNEDAFADLLMVVEFTHAFGEVIIVQVLIL